MTLTASIKKYSRLWVPVLMTAFLFLFSCYYDVEEELYPIDSNAACDTTNVTYTLSIKPIMDASCNNCHSTQVASGGIILDTYAGISAVAASGKLGGSVNWTGGYSAMPKGGSQLSPCNLKKINIWLAANHPKLFTF